MNERFLMIVNRFFAILITISKTQFESLSFFPRWSFSHDSIKNLFTKSGDLIQACLGVRFDWSEPFSPTFFLSIRDKKCYREKRLAVIDFKTYPLILKRWKSERISSLRRSRKHLASSVTHYHIKYEVKGLKLIIIIILKSSTNKQCNERIKSFKKIKERKLEFWW